MRIQTLHLIILFILFPGSEMVRGQGIERFTLDDFDLRGPVEKCVVITAYGKEEYSFNREGLLTRVLTRYNEQDLDITHYRYRDNLLSEKRDEVYRDGKFDTSTSLAHFYSRDTLGENDSLPSYVLRERILSYDQQINELNEFYYNEDGRLTRRVHSTAEGIDDLTQTYESSGDTLIGRVYQNDVLTQLLKEYAVIRDSADTLKYKENTKYISGEPETRDLKILDPAGKVLEQQQWIFDPAMNKFRSEKRTQYTYNEEGVLKEEVSSIAKRKEKKEYIYQFDNGKGGNWVKQIILPENAYTTRKITYYKKEEKKGSGKEKRERN